MTGQVQESLSPGALALLAELRTWTANLPLNSVIVREDYNPGYGGVLFEVRPTRPGAMWFKVGLGSSDDVGFFWGDGYRWEGWKATAREVLELCEAIKDGDVIEETWTLARFVIEKRCHIRAAGRRAADGSPPMPRWFKHWAHLSVRTYSPWVATEAA